MGQLTVTFPNLAALLVDWIVGNLPAGTYVGIVRPAAIAGRNVVLVRPNGGPQVGRVLRAETVAVTVLAPDDETVTVLAEQVVNLIRILGTDPQNNGPVSAVEILSAPSEVIDDSLVPCRLFTAQLWILGS